MRLSDDARCFALMALTTCLLSANCKQTSQGRTTIAPTTDPGSPMWRASDMQKLDVLVTPEMLFPEDHQRALFEIHPPTTEKNTRTYAFELKPQAGMVTPRHFFLVMVSFTHLSGSRRMTDAPSMLSTGGPNGSFLEASGTTADDVYDVRVSQAMLLPDGVRLSPFHPKKALVEVLHRYENWKKDKAAISPTEQTITVYHANAKRLEDAQLAAPYNVAIRPWHMVDQTLARDALVDVSRKP